jgi:DNA-binding transcriptional regulator YhcF (GntR family)
MPRKRSAALQKSVTHIRHKVRDKTWKLGEKVDNISKISNKINVSYATLKKAFAIVCDDGLLEDRDRGNYFVVNRTATRLKTALNVHDGISKIAIQLKSAKLINNGGIFNDKTVSIVNKINHSLSIFFPYTDEEIKFELNDIVDTLNKPLMVNDVINDPKLKDEFETQANIKEYLYIILPALKKLNIG